MVVIIAESIVSVLNAGLGICPINTSHYRDGSIRHDSVNSIVSPIAVGNFNKVTDGCCALLMCRLLGRADSIHCASKLHNARRYGLAYLHGLTRHFWWLVNLGK